MKCTICNNEFKNSYNLTAHQKTAKYCIKLQGKDNKEFDCEFCHKKLSTNHRLLTHLLTCKNKIQADTWITYEKNTQHLNDCILHKDSLISKLEAQVKDLQDQLASIAKAAASKPINVNNTQTINQVINNLTPLTDEYLKETAQYLTIDHVKKGAEGYAKFALDYPFKNRITCVDVSRRKVKYKNKDGSVITDPEMTILAKKLFASIDDANIKLMTDYINELNKKMIKAHTDAKDEMTEEESNQVTAVSCAFVDEISDLVSQKFKIKDIITGGRNEMFHEFIKNVCMNST